MKKVRIVHLITSLEIGGAELVLYRLVTGMNSDIFQNIVVGMTPMGSVGTQLASEGIAVYSLNMARGQPTFRGFKQLMELLRTQKPDVIQTWLYHADLLGSVAGYFTRTAPVVWNVRSADMDMQKYRRLSAIVVRMCAFLSRLPDAVVVNSRVGRNFHERIGYRPRRWVLIPNGVDIQKFQPDISARVSVRTELGLSETSILIGLLARWDPMKDHASFFHAAAQLAAQTPDVHFLLAGQEIVPSNPELNAFLDAYSLHGRVSLLGKRLDVSSLMSALDIATSSSLSEGFPNTVVEAMACAIPCVVTSAGDSAEIVGESGIVVPTKNPDALALAWQALVALDRQQRSVLGAQARQRIVERYSLPTMIEAYENLYLEMAKSGNSNDTVR